MMKSMPQINQGSRKGDKFYAWICVDHAHEMFSDKAFRSEAVVC